MEPRYGVNDIHEIRSSIGSVIHTMGEQLTPEIENIDNLAVRYAEDKKFDVNKLKVTRALASAKTQLDRLEVFKRMIYDELGARAKAGLYNLDLFKKEVTRRITGEQNKTKEQLDANAALVAGAKKKRTKAVIGSVASGTVLGVAIAFALWAYSSGYLCPQQSTDNEKLGIDIALTSGEEKNEGPKKSGPQRGSETEPQVGGDKEEGGEVETPVPDGGVTGGSSGGSSSGGSSGGGTSTPEPAKNLAAASELDKEPHTFNEQQIDWGYITKDGRYAFSVGGKVFIGEKGNLKNSVEVTDETDREAIIEEQGRLGDAGHVADTTESTGLNPNQEAAQGENAKNVLVTGVKKNEQLNTWEVYGSDGTTYYYDNGTYYTKSADGSKEYVNEQGVVDALNSGLTEQQTILQDKRNAPPASVEVIIQSENGTETMLVPALNGQQSGGQPQGQTDAEAQAQAQADAQAQVQADAEARAKANNGDLLER